MDKNIAFRDATERDRIKIQEIMEKDWGGEPLVVHRKNYYTKDLEGLVAVDDSDEILGFLFYDWMDKSAEIIVFEVYDKFQGLGTEILNTLIQKGKKGGLDKLEVMTTNDNIDALRYYQRRDFVIDNIDVGAVNDARKMKATIPERGDYGIPLRDEINLVYPLHG